MPAPKSMIGPRYKVGTVVSNLKILEHLGIYERPHKTRSHNKRVHTYRVRCKHCNKTSEYLEDTIAKRVALDAKLCKRCANGHTRKFTKKDNYYATPEEREYRRVVQWATAHTWQPGYRPRKGTHL